MVRPRLRLPRRGAALLLLALPLACLAPLATAQNVPKVEAIGAVAQGFEGSSVGFEILVDYVLTADLTLDVNVTDAVGDSDFLDAENEGVHKVTIPAGKWKTRFYLRTTDDYVDEPRGEVTATILEKDHYEVVSGRQRSWDSALVYDNDDPPGLVPPFDPKRPLVGINISGGQINEGGKARFCITATRAGALRTDLTLDVSVADAVGGGDFLDAENEGVHKVTIPAGWWSRHIKWFEVQTTNDDADEPHGEITATILERDHYRVWESQSSAYALVYDDDGASTCRPARAELVKKVRGYYELNRDRADRNHGENWLRVLIAFGAETHATLQPYTAAEARVGERAWSGWKPVREELEHLEACGVVVDGQRSEVQQAPEVTLSGGSPVTEGGDATFTLTATPAPTSDIQVSVTVSETGSFAASGEAGARTVTVGAGGTADFTVATDDDAVDEADGSIDAAVTSGDGYTVGSSASASVAVSDNDVPEVNITAVSGGTEGANATFTLTATPAPASNLAVSVTVTATGDYGVATGDRAVTIPTTGSATLAVATADDGADEPNGSVTLTLNAGDGYAVGALSSVAADILDDDEPAVEPAVQIAPTSQALIGEVRRYYEANRNNQSRNFGSNWLRVLIAFGDRSDSGYTPFTVAEAKKGEAVWAGWTPVRKELERLNTGVDCVAGQLKANVTGYAKESEHGALHQERWRKVLNAFNGQTPKATPDEVAAWRDSLNTARWTPVVSAFRCLEANSLL